MERRDVERRGVAGAVGEAGGRGRVGADDEGQGGRRARQLRVDPVAGVRRERDGRQRVQRRRDAVRNNGSNAADGRDGGAHGLDDVRRV